MTSTRLSFLNEPYPPLEEWLRSFTIITTKPNELTTVHDRMSVILYPEDYDEWLMRVDGEDPQANLLRPYPAEEMKAKKALNDMRNVRNNPPRVAE
jgi:putative SOS response-associated peptidase YedK